MNRTLRKRSDILVALLALAAAVPGLGRDLSVFFWKAGELRTTRSEDRFVGLALPPGERVGFVTDVPGADATRRYYEALYAFAPAVLLPGPDARLVLADVREPESISRICAQWKLRVVARGTPGVALLERE
jgi:hypothetical protein